MDISREFLQQVKEIVCSCEPIMTRAFTVAEKGTASNLVTTSDTAVQEMLKEKLDELLPQAVFLGEQVTKYHRTLTSYVGALLSGGFTLTGLAEPQPPQEMIGTVPGMADELRRPMMLILSAKKQ